MPISQKIKPILVYTTYPSLPQAQEMAILLLQKRLAAGTNIFSGVQSLFWWNQHVTTSEESILIIKTTNACFAEVEKTILSTHPYTCPCILQIDISNGYAPFLDWIRTETTPENTISQKDTSL